MARGALCTTSDQPGAWLPLALLGGTSGDIVAAAMTELPTVKQGVADQFSATRGGGSTCPSAAN